MSIFIGYRVCRRGLFLFILEHLSKEFVLFWAHSFCDPRRASSSSFAREPQSPQSAATFDHARGCRKHVQGAQAATGCPARPCRLVGIVTTQSVVSTQPAVGTLGGDLPHFCCSIHKLAHKLAPTSPEVAQPTWRSSRAPAAGRSPCWHARCGPFERLSHSPPIHCTPESPRNFNLYIRLVV